MVEQSLFQDQRVAKTPRSDQQDGKKNRNEENAARDNRVRKQDIEKRQKDSGKSQGLQQTDSQLVEAVGDFQVVKIVVIKTGLADSGNQKNLHQQLAVKNKRFLAKDNHRRQQHRNKDKDALAGDEENVAQGIIFFKNLKHR